MVTSHSCCTTFLLPRLSHYIHCCVVMVTCCMWLTALFELTNHSPADWKRGWMMQFTFCVSMLSRARYAITSLPVPLILCYFINACWYLIIACQFISFLIKHSIHYASFFSFHLNQNHNNFTYFSLYVIHVEHHVNDLACMYWINFQMSVSKDQNHSTCHGAYGIYSDCFSIYQMCGMNDCIGNLFFSL